MAKGIEPAEAAAVSPDPDRLHTAAREARDDAAPFAIAAAGILTALALVSRHAHWELLGHRLWWIWLLVSRADARWRPSGFQPGSGRRASQTTLLL